MPLLLTLDPVHEPAQELPDDRFLPVVGAGLPAPVKSAVARTGA